MRKFDQWPSARAALLLFVGAGVVFVVLRVSILIAGPETVPGHFSFDGTVTRFDPTLGFLVFIGLFAVGLAGLCLAAARLPVECINLPRREEWNTPERRARLRALLTAGLRVMGAATLLLLAAMLAISRYVGLGGQIDSWILAVAAGGCVVAIAIVAGRMLAGGRYTPPG